MKYRVHLVTAWAVLASMAGCVEGAPVAGAPYSPEMVVYNGDREYCTFIISPLTAKMVPSYTITDPENPAVINRKWLTVDECCGINGDKHIGWRQAKMIGGNATWAPICR